MSRVGPGLNRRWIEVAPLQARSPVEIRKKRRKPRSLHGGSLHEAPPRLCWFFFRGFGVWRFVSSVPLRPEGLGSGVCVVEFQGASCLIVLYGS